MWGNVHRRVRVSLPSLRGVVCCPRASFGQSTETHDDVAVSMTWPKIYRTGSVATALPVAALPLTRSHSINQPPCFSLALGFETMHCSSSTIAHHTPPLPSPRLHSSVVWLMRVIGCAQVWPTLGTITSGLIRASNVLYHRFYSVQVGALSRE